MSDVDAAPRFDRWGGETLEDRIVASFARLEAALLATPRPHRALRGRDVNWLDLPGHVLALLYVHQFAIAVGERNPIGIVASVAAVLSCLWLVEFGRTARKSASNTTNQQGVTP